MGQNILWFRDINKDDTKLVGTKGTNLGELTNAGLNVPPGFVITTNAYFDFLKSTDLAGKIKGLLKKIDPNDSKKLHEISAKIQKLIIDKPVPKSLTQEINKSYKELYLNGSSNIFVAVRSSIVDEEVQTANFSGQSKTFLNIVGSDEVVNAVKECWASLFCARAIYYRALNKIDQLKVGMAVPIQKMVQAEKSGIIFTSDPISSNPNKIIIEAGLGLGEAIVSGLVTPDMYVVSKGDYQILEKIVNRQQWKIVRNRVGNKHVAIPAESQNNQTLTDSEVVSLAKIAEKIETHYGMPQDIEWAIEGRELYFLQSGLVAINEKQTDVNFWTSDNKLGQLKCLPDGKPILANSQQPTVNGFDSNSSNKPEAVSGQPEAIVKGIPASLGFVSGRVRVLHKILEIEEVEKGDILVAEKMTLDFLPAIKKAGAIILDTDSVNSFIAYSAQDLGIPCIVSCGSASHSLKDNQIVTVDGVNGLVYKGNVKQKDIPVNNCKEKRKLGDWFCNLDAPKTSIKVYVDLDNPRAAARLAGSNCDGVGILPIKLADGATDMNKITNDIQSVCQVFAPRPVICKTADFKISEFRNLDLFKKELEAINKIRNNFGLKNLWLAIPFVRTIDEMKKIMMMIEASRLEQSRDFKVWMTIQTPSNMILIEQFCALGIDGVMIDTDILAQLIMGVDYSNKRMASFAQELDESVKQSLEKIIDTCQSNNVSVSVSGKLVENNMEMIEYLVGKNILSVTVPSQAVLPVRRLISSIEKKILN
jgi:pyruvate,water dikinase